MAHLPLFDRSREFNDFIATCLNKDRVKRKSAAEMLQVTTTIRHNEAQS